MARFDYDRAATFGAYTISAMVRDAGEKGKIFTKVSRKDLAQALGTAKLHFDHTEAVRASLLKEGIGMADMGTHFVFFYDSGLDELAEPLDPDLLSAVTDHFERLSTKAANESWNDKSYLPKPGRRRTPAEPAAAGIVKRKVESVRVRGAA